MANGNTLSKSKLMAHRQCPKRLWLSKHRPDLAEESSSTELVFAHGHEVGAVARTLYGDGELLSDHEQPNIPQALKRTRQLMAADQGTLYEAAFSADGVLVLADVLKWSAGGAKLIEVKATGSVKDEHYADCAIQSHVIEHSGTRLKAIKLAHVDTSFVYPGDANYRGLLVEADLRKEVSELREEVPQWIKDAKATLKGPEPAIAPGRQCTTPYTCPFYDHCNKQTAEYPVSVLPRLRQNRLDAFRAQGYEDLRKLPRDLLTNETHQRVYDATKSGKPFRNKAVAAQLRSLPYPRYHLDFETIAFAVPIWAGTRPYQQIPFQWSVHIEPRRGALDHAEFLDLSGTDPSRAGAEALIRTLGQKARFSCTPRSKIPSCRNWPNASRT